MKPSHRLILTGLPIAATAGAPAAAQSLDLTVTLPRVSVAEYHKPYVAIWLEAPDRSTRTLQVWYDVDNARGEGQKWLVDVRQWWRASGRSLRLPADGVSGATRGPGPQRVTVPAAKLAGLAPGQYTLLVEAAREVGGREVVRLPLTLKPGQTATASGKTEIAAVTATVRR